MRNLKLEFWFVTGSQHLYGEDTLHQVAQHSKEIADYLSHSPAVLSAIVYKPVLTTPDAILRLCTEANADESCAGIITWMHTFSPAKMWIAGLGVLKKPLLHFHTQYNRDIPWGSIDMDFMNLNQAAHGDREFGFMCTRMNLYRKVVVGHWQDTGVISRIAGWMRTATAASAGRGLKIARFGDNMREVAVTEGDKVEAQLKFGWSVSGYGIGDIVKRISEISPKETCTLFEEYSELYDIPSHLREGKGRDSVLEQARMELGIKAFLQEGGFEAFTTTFEDLHGLSQLPGLAVQRLMAAGYGFGAEGDWKTAALVRVMKLMSNNQSTSFMEDYTYHLEPENELVLGAHMLEVCPTIAAAKPRLEVHPLGIGGKDAPARLIFEGRSGPGVCASLIDLGNRFRLIVNTVDAVNTANKMPRLPVASVLWKPRPSLYVGAEAWILSGGAHHTCFSLALTEENLADWANLSGIECVLINENTKMSMLQNELRWSDIYWKMH